MLGLLTEVLEEHFTRNFCTSLDEGRLSADSLTLTTTSDRNGGDTGNCGSHGRVRFASTVLKTIEEILHDRIVTHLKASKLMLGQHGF